MKRLEGFVGLLCVVGAMLFVATGCGGGGGGSAQSPPKIAFNTGITAAVSDTDRAATESAVQQKWGTLIGQPMVTQAQGVVAFMKTQKTIRAGGVSSDNSCWAEYTDGVSLVVATNDPKLEKISPGSYVGTPLAKAQRDNPFTLASGPTGKVKANLLPGSQKAYVLDSLEAARNSSAATISGELKAKGYDATYSTGSLADWKAVTNAGVLVASTHGGFSLATKTLVISYVLEAEDTVSIIGEASHKAEIDAGTLGHILVNELDSSGKVHPANHYGFNARWLTNEQMFAKQSLMLNMACSGREETSFRSRLQIVLGLDVYGGWSTPVGDQDSFNTGLLFFDRALGLNKFEPVDPSMPAPATWQSIGALLTKTKRPGSTGNYDQSFLGNAPSVFKFEDSTPASQLDTIVPSIEDGAPSNIANEYILNGHFGTDQGTASLGGTPLTIRSWSPTQVYITTPPANGTIVLKEDGLISNEFNYGGLTVTPTTSSVVGGATVQFTVKPVSGVTGTVQYVWSQTTADAEFQSSDKVFGNSIKTSSTSVGLLTTSHDTVDDTITVIENVTSNGVTKKVGETTVTVSFIGISLTPTNPQVSPAAQKVFTLGATTGTLPTGVSFKWTLTGKGNLAGGNPVTTTTPTITYTAGSGIGTDTLQVQMIGAGGAVLGTASTTINVIPALTVSPSVSVLAYNAGTGLTVGFPKGFIPTDTPTFTWTFTAGNGSLGLLGGTLGSSVTTQDREVHYACPKATDTDATIQVVGKYSDGTVMGVGTATVYVRKLQAAGTNKYGVYAVPYGFTTAARYASIDDFEINYGTDQTTGAGGLMVIAFPIGSKLSVGQKFTFPGETGNNVNPLKPGNFVFGGDLGDSTLTIKSIQTFPGGWYVFSYTIAGASDNATGSFAAQYYVAP